MGKMKVHYASFPYDEIWAFSSGLTIKKGFFTRDEHINGDDIATLEPASEHNVKRFAGATGWGVVGAALAGPVGAVAGVLLGGNSSDTTFTLETYDGRVVIGTIPTKTFNGMLASKLKFDEMRRPLLEIQEQMERDNQERKEFAARMDQMTIDQAVAQGRPRELIDPEMEIKAGRYLHEPDYKEWKDRTGESVAINDYILATGYKLPEDIPIPSFLKEPPDWMKKNPNIKITQE